MSYYIEFRGNKVRVSTASRAVGQSSWTDRKVLRAVLRGIIYAAASCTFITSAPAVGAPVAFENVVELAQQRGWRVELGDMCAKLEMPPPSGSCSFHQISVQEVEGRGDPRAINIPVGSTPEVPYILIFHLSPLVGEFFLVSPKGALLRAFVRSKGRDYAEVSNETVREEFNKDLSYWTTNYSRLRQAFEASRSER